MESSPTRRRLLGGLAATGATAGATALGVETLAGPAPTFDPWEPDAGEWPAARRGPRRRAAAPDATPPSTAPDVGWTAEADVGEVDASAALVVADGAAFLGGESGVAAVDVESGDLLWERDVPGDRLCVHGGTLYCGARGASLAAFEAADGEGSWRVDLDEGEHVYDVLALDGTLLVGRHGWLEGRDPGSGDRRWRLDVGGLGSVYPAAVDDRLYLGGPGPLETYAPRHGWDAVLEGGPRQVAAGLGPIFGYYPVVDEEAVYVFDRNGANRLWAGPEAPYLWSPAIAGDVGAVRTYDVDASRSPFRLVGVDLGDGSTTWRRPPRADLTRPVVAGDLAAVASEDGTVRAFDTRTGETVWEATVPGTPGAVIPVGERLLVAGRDGTLWSLR